MADKNQDPTMDKGHDNRLDQLIKTALEQDHNPKEDVNTRSLLDKLTLKKGRLPFWEYLILLIALMLIIGIGMMVNSMIV